MLLPRDHGCNVALLSLQMWRGETGFLETFLAYYSQFDENVMEKKAYRDFLVDIISAHENSLL